MKLKNQFLPFGLLILLSACGGGSSDGRRSDSRQPEEAPRNPTTNCSISIVHPEASGTAIDCFSLTVSETNQIIKSVLGPKNYTFPSAGGTQVLTSFVTCTENEGEETGPFTAMFALAKDGNGGRDMFNGEGTAATWRQADELALRDTLSKIPDCRE